jgi:hypothetical protein
VQHYGGYHKKTASFSQPLLGHRHPVIISESGNWSTECSCGAF